MAENLRGKSTTIILLSLVLNCFLYSYPYTHKLQLPDFMREVAIYSGQQQMQKSELVQVQRISVYEIHSPKWDIYVMPAPPILGREEAERISELEVGEDCRKTVSVF